MLTNVRGNLDSFFVKVLLAILVAAFAVWGIGPTMFAGNTNIVANVGDEEINRVDYEIAVRRQARQFQMQYQLPMSEAEIIQNAGIAQRVLGEMMVDAAYRANATDLGMRISKQEIAEELRNIEPFQMGGVFSSQAMQSFLDSNQMTYKELEKSIELSLIRRQVIEALFAHKPAASKLAETLYAYDNERRDATIITITRDDITDKDITAVSEADILTAYEKGKEGYKTDEMRTYDYVLLSPTAYSDQVTVTDAEIKSLYDSKSAEYNKPESRAFNHISFDDAAKAADFIRQVNAGADFVQTAAKVTEFSADEISIGEFTADKLTENYSKEASTAAFATTEKGLSVPVKSLAGFDVFQTTAIKAAELTSLDSVKATLKQTLTTEKATKLMYQATNDIETEIASGISFGELVEKFNLSAANIEATNSYGVDKDGKPAVTSQEGRVILQDAFTLEEGDDPELKDIDKGDATKGMYLVNVNKIEIQRTKTLEEMTETLRASLTNERKLEKAGERAEAMMERLGSGADAAKLIEEFGGISFAAKRIGRTTDPKSSLSQNIRDLLFTLDVKAIDVERTADNNGYVVVRNDAITPTDLVANAEALKKFSKTISDELTNDIAAQYQTNLFKLYKPTENRALIQQLFQTVEQ